MKQTKQQRLDEMMRKLQQIKRGQYAPPRRLNDRLTRLYRLYQKLKEQEANK